MPRCKAVTAACAMLAVGGELQCKVWPRDDSERQYAIDEGIDLNRVLTTRDLVDSDHTFFAATGVSTGDLLEGVVFTSHGARTHTVVMRSHTGTVRFIDALHRFDPIG